MQDVKFVGITNLIKVIEATTAPVVELPIANEEFKKYFLYDNGIILKKRQCNFESIYDKKLSNKEV